MKRVKEFFNITIGIILVAIGLEYFFFPNNIAAGGVSGFALVIQDVINIEAGTIMWICNIVLFILAFVCIGGSFGKKSIYATFGLSAILSTIEKLGLAYAITDNIILATVFGSVFSALGGAIVFNQGASTGGTSITAKLLSKYLNMDIGKGLLISDSIVIILAIYNFGVELGLFGLIAVYLVSTLIDKFISGINSCKQVIIFTSNEEMVSEYIIKDIDRGCTVFDGRGGYTGNKNSVIFTVLDRRQFIKLKQFIKENDSTAFITVNEATEVLGKGFVNLTEE
ncbi:MAG: YitT family protein [Clostridium sp.]|jgi:uncharacterized membrane-anchored protein YitT (DUF2179 family)|nr:YitT family protein [Clostridium sp.]